MENKRIYKYQAHSITKNGLIRKTDTINHCLYKKNVLLLKCAFNNNLIKVLRFPSLIQARGEILTSGRTGDGDNRKTGVR